MKQKKSARDVSKILSWWLILTVVGFLVWALEINRKTIFDFSWWWFVLCFIVGFVIGVVRLVRDKEIVWNWLEYFGGFYYTLVHSAMGVMIGVLLVFGIEMANYYIPTDNPYYNESATVYGKKRIRSRKGTDYNVEFDFENEKFGAQTLRLGSDFFNQVEKGDKYIFTLQNGFFNIPVIIEKTKKE